ncbi:MAG: PD-(D/E)XK nuclease family transposase [Lachnospiraceae bacterium]|nr:PD-(D/E)XK nuclease family transposase [Lachnospiraceae bacterium]
MSVNNTSNSASDSVSRDGAASFLPSFSSHEEVKQYFEKYPAAWASFLKLPAGLQRELLDFCIGEHGLRVTYDPVFQRVFHPARHPERLESFLSSFLGKNVRIIDILPRQGTQLVEKGSFVILDALVQLDDGSYANVEMQKIGYKFPLARTDCYVSDIIMRQYGWKRAQMGKEFSFHKLQKVYCIILMEQSPAEFHTAKGDYIHKRSSYFNTGIFHNNSGLHEEFFICLDIFHSNVHNITKYSTILDAWLTFFSTTDLETIRELVRNFPMFRPVYQEITEFVREPEELMHMFTEELYIMDRNMERLMVSELQDEVNELKSTMQAERSTMQAALDTVQAERNMMQAALDTVQTERNAMQAALATVQTEKNVMQAELDVFKLYLKGKTPEEIAEELSISIERVNEIFGESN